MKEARREWMRWAKKLSACGVAVCARVCCARARARERLMGVAFTRNVRTRHLSPSAGRAVSASARSVLALLAVELPRRPPSLSAPLIITTGASAARRDSPPDDDGQRALWGTREAIEAGRSDVVDPSTGSATIVDVGDDSGPSAGGVDRRHRGLDLRMMWTVVCNVLFCFAHVPSY